MVTPEEMIDGLNSVFGLHRGRRTLHAKGTFCRGTFTPTEEAGRLSRAIHMQGPVEVTARLSNGSGDPASLDYSADVRGLAVTFHLPDSGRTDILAQTSPRFPVRTPDDFLALTRAVQPGAGLLWRFPAYLARHPGAVTTLAAGAKAAKTARTRGRLPLRPLQLAAGGERARHLRRGGKEARARLPPGGPDCSGRGQGGSGLERPAELIAGDDHPVAAAGAWPHTAPRRRCGRGRGARPPRPARR